MRKIQLEQLADDTWGYWNKKNNAWVNPPIEKIKIIEENSIISAWFEFDRPII